MSASLASEGNRILVIRGGAIGDFILTLPVLAALRRHFPQSRLEVLGYPHIARLALIGGLAHEVRPVEAQALAGFFARRGQLKPELQAYFRSFAIIVSYLYDPDGIFRENVGHSSSATFISCPHRPVDTEDIHATEVFLRPLQQLAIFGADPMPRLELPRALASSPGALCPRLAVHPGSGSPRKNWPQSRWAELLARLVEQTSWRLLLVGGEAEADRLEQLARLVPPGRCETAFSRPLPELASHLARSDWFLGHDSGISHLAAALGLPTIVLWGDTREAVWRPLGTNVTLLRAPGGLSILDVTEVLRALSPRGQVIGHLRL